MSEPKSKASTPELPKLDVLYEDNHLIAVNKPAGILVQGDDTKDESLFDIIRQWIKIKYQKPGNVYLGIVHRLDRPASGVVVFAKTSKGASRLSEQFRKHTPEKIYKCIVHNTPKNNSGKLINYLQPLSGKKNIMQISRNNIGKKSILNYKTIKHNKKYSELEVTLDTGRKHQIRLQLSNINCPILGDLKYGSKEKVANGKALCLHASKLTIIHPTKKNTLKITAPTPKHWTKI